MPRTFNIVLHAVPANPVIVDSLMFNSPDLVTRLLLWRWWHIWLISVLSAYPAFNQCSGDLWLTTQEQIDSFTVDYPGCTVWQGSMNIYGEGVLHLNGLSSLTGITEGIYISYAPMLTSLDGLEQLTVCPLIDIRENQSLADISALSGITSTGSEDVTDGNLIIRWCPSLNSLHGLHNITTIGGYLWIEHNQALASLGGLSSLTAVSNTMWINDNDNLQDFSGLENLTSVYRIGIVEHEALQSLAGLEGIVEVPEGLIIRQNPSLTSLTGLDNLTFVGREFYIQTNPIKSLEALGNLTTIGGDPDETAFYMDGLTIVVADSLTTLEGLENLASVSGSLRLGSLIGLRDLNGLNGLQSIGGSLFITFNAQLETLEGLNNLTSIGRDLQITSNPELTACAIEPICNYLEDPAGDIIISNFGAIGCRNEGDILSRCSPVRQFDMIDANLTAYPGAQDPVTEDIRDLDPGDLTALDAIRTAVATDGVSTVLIRLYSNEHGRIDLMTEEGTFELPWGDTTHLIDGQHFAFLLYTPPDEFSPPGPTYMLNDVVEAYDQEIAFDFTGETNNHSVSKSIPLARPPVVLMHGTYGNPDSTWRRAVSGGKSMYEMLTEAGLAVFTVDYSETNGNDNNSSFAENTQVLWGDVYPSNTGGIKSALDYYRDSVDIAATQVDIVGHSLGGVLPRVYASEHYNDQYRRAENFMEGDINRLITIASTHYGSHLGELQVFLQDASIFDLGPLDWIAVQAQARIASRFAGAPATSAVRDQLPPPGAEALELIGGTGIPSHAITCSVPIGELKDPVHDPHEEYYDLFWYIALLMYHNDDLRDLYLDYKVNLAQMGLTAATTLEGGDPQELFPGYTDLIFFRNMINDGLHLSGQALSIMDGTFELPSDIEIFSYVMSEVGMGDVTDPLLQIYEAYTDPVGVANGYVTDAFMPDPEEALNSYLTVYDETMEALRALIFNNDANDGVVRVESQEGNLDQDYISHFENVLHGFAPRYAEVQLRVLELLKGGMDMYQEDGFPAVESAQLLYYPDNVLSLFKIPRTGATAICQSGMPPSHARALAAVADARNAIIIARPVNPDATQLIERGAATKKMDVKPKSSNWGPQKGYLASNQRYSKLWKVFEGEKRDEMITKYNQKVTENLTTGITVERHLQVDVCNGTFLVYIDENRNIGINDMSAEDEVVLVPMQDPSMVCTWGSNFSLDMQVTDCVPQSDAHFLTPFKVMASPDVFEEDGVTPRYLTADYDLLMVGFYQGPDQEPPEPPDVPFQDGVGQITSAQADLVGLMNDAVADAGYTGGNVTHHGPENQFSASPYVDYPLTVFAPDEIPNGFFSGSTGGKILSIEMGPRGFRDIHLKRFINRMREEGYDLYHNPEAPGWKWQWDDGVPGYKLEDDKDIADYVEQLPENTCDKTGAQLGDVCPDRSGEDAMQPVPRESWLTGLPAGNLNILLKPNPVYDDRLIISVESTFGEDLHFIITDANGHRRCARKIRASQGWSQHVIDVSRLEQGMYTVTLLPQGLTKRFVRM